MAAGGITLEYLSYNGAKDNPGGGCRAVFDFQGSDGGSLYVGYTFQIGIEYEPKAVVLANNVAVEGLTGIITEVAHETASYATGKLEIYALQYGTTYNIATYDMSGTPMSDIAFTPQANNAIKAKNLVSGTLAGDITTSTTNILVHIADSISAQGILDFFPNPPFYITIMPKTPTIGVANRLDSEIIKITNVGNDQVGNAALTGVRAQRDTTAKAFSAGDIVTVGSYCDDAVFLGEDGTEETETPWVGTGMIQDDAVTPEKASFTKYSTNETRIGTWVDGKPLYRKVVQFTSPSNVYTFTQVPTGITDADYAFIENGAIKHATEGWTIQINSARGTSDDAMMNWAVAAWVRLQLNATNFVISVAGGLNNQPMWVSVLYTKTTD